jgi:uncharacterized membrane protein YhaH (DUF805 family)
MNWYLDVFYEYAVFKGRAGRKDFWMFYLINLIFMAIALFIDRVNGLGSNVYFAGPIFIIYMLLILLPMCAVCVRRLHDTGRSGWMVFVKLIPVIGSIWLVILLATAGDKGKNAYGEDPNAQL